MRQYTNVLSKGLMMKHKEFKVINKGEIDRIEKEVQALLDEDCGWQVLFFW